MAVVICLFLAFYVCDQDGTSVGSRRLALLMLRSLQREKEERFKKIDLKRGAMMSA